MTGSNPKPKVNLQMPKEYKTGDTLTTECETGVLEYQPGQDPTTPWILYWDGVANLAFESVDAAAKWLKQVKNTTLEIP